MPLSEVSAANLRHIVMDAYQRMIDGMAATFSCRRRCAELALDEDTPDSDLREGRGNKLCLVCCSPIDGDHAAVPMPCCKQDEIHKDCLDSWLSLNSTCIFCRAHVLEDKNVEGLPCDNFDVGANPARESDDEEETKYPTTSILTMGLAALSYLLYFS